MVNGKRILNSTIILLLSLQLRWTETKGLGNAGTFLRTRRQAFVSRMRSDVELRFNQ